MCNIVCSKFEMDILYVKYIWNVLKFIYVMEITCIISKLGIRKREKFIFLCFYMVGFILLEKDNYQSYILQCLYFLFIILIPSVKNKVDKSKILADICIVLTVSEFLNLLGNILGAFIAAFLKYPVEGELESIALFAFIAKIFLFMQVKYVVQKNAFNIELSFMQKCLTCFICFCVLMSKIPFIYTDIRDGLMWKVFFVTIICCTVIFFIISRIERHNAEMERAKIEENNKTLSTKLHKSQEIIPAVVQVLNNVTENSGKEMEEQETQKLLSEMTDLFGQQLKENSKEDLQLKNFCSTGLKVLDQQLKGYQIEAVNRGINLDIYVQAPINDIMKKDSIDQMKLQRALGDMIRNAFRATEIKRENEKCHANGHILLIIGCQYKDILEIAVVDNGTEIPLHVIEMFGKRGVTTGGTGNGLADLVEFTDETKASIRVEEFAWETSSFTKKISIIFDNQRENCFISARAELINSSFWKKESNY